jgi:hypothetical protein
MALFRKPLLSQGRPVENYYSVQLTTKARPAIFLTQSRKKVGSRFTEVRAMGAPYILTLLSEDGYQVFAALHQEFETLNQAIEGAKSDYLKRYGGNPAFRVYHAEGEMSGYRHTLIEVCFDESKRRSFVALYKVLKEVERAPTQVSPPRFSIPTLARTLCRLLAQFGHRFTRPRASGAILGFR